MGLRGNARKKRKKQAQRAHGVKQVVADPHRLRLFLAISFAYVACVALLSLILGVTIATFLATPIWAFLFLAFSGSGRSNQKGAYEWLRSIRFPRLNYANVAAIAGTIFVIQGIGGYIWAIYLSNTRPDISCSVCDDWFTGLQTLANDTQSLTVICFAAALSYLAGGYLAGIVRNRKCPAPYRHAIFGAMATNFLNLSIMLPIVMLNVDPEDQLTTSDVVVILLMTIPSYLLAALGTRIAVGPGKKKEAEVDIKAGSSPIDVEVKPKSRWKQRLLRVKRFMLRRTVVTGTIALVILTPTGILAWRYYKAHKVTFCPNPPTTATLNPWPVSYTSPAEMCHDYPSIDARLIEADHYSRSREEWERGLSTKAGDEFYVIIYIDNGADDHAEELNPGRGIARNVAITTEISAEGAATHYIEVSFGGDNTNTVVNRFRITTTPLGRLEPVAKSGEIFNFVTSQLIAKDFEMGNNTVQIGDLAPKWDASVFLRFRVKVLD